MDPRRFDRLAAGLGNRLVAATGRRAFLGGAATLAVAVAASVVPHEATARKRKKKKCKNCCRNDGQSCRKKNNGCQPSFCLGAPLTIEAVWTNAATDHDTFLFVPNQPDAALPSPFIRYDCTPAFSACQNALYPFTCVSQDAQGPGDEVTTVRKLLVGTYEYWIGLAVSAPVDDLTVSLRRSDGSLVRSWSSPANPNGAIEIGWHVFDIDGATASMTSVDQTIATAMPNGAHDSNTDVCPK